MSKVIKKVSVVYSLGLAPCNVFFTRCLIPQPSTPEIRQERDIFLYRALIGQRKYGVVLSEIKPSSPVPLQALRLLARYLQSPEGRCVAHKSTSKSK